MLDCIILNTADTRCIFQFKCCGANDYTDFTGASQWVTDYSSYPCSCTLMTPLSCCKTLPSSTDFSCATSSATSSDNYLNTVRHTAFLAALPLKIQNLDHKKYHIIILKWKRKPKRHRYNDKRFRQRGSGCYERSTPYCDNYFKTMQLSARN